MTTRYREMVAEEVGPDGTPGGPREVLVAEVRDLDGNVLGRARAAAGLRAVLRGCRVPCRVDAAEWGERITAAEAAGAGFCLDTVAMGSTKPIYAFTADASACRPPPSPPARPA
jgi:hypothetical protein